MIEPSTPGLTQKEGGGAALPALSRCAGSLGILSPASAASVRSQLAAVRFWDTAMTGSWAFAMTMVRQVVEHQR